MKYLSFIAIGLFIITACNDDIRTLENETAELNNQVNALQSKIDSLKNLPSVKFETIISKDFLFDSLRKKSTSTYLSPLQNDELKTSDSMMIKAYINFAKNHQDSYFSMYAIDRIKTIGEKQRILKVNQIVGTWNWETRTNIFIPSKLKKSEQIVFGKDKTVKFFKNEKLVSQEKYEFLLQDLYGQYIKFSKRGVYSIHLKKNGIMTLTKGKGRCIDCASDVFKKSRENS